MSRATSFLIFFGIALLVLGAAHYYVYARLIRDPQLPRQLTRALSILLALGLLSIPLTMIVSRQLPTNLAGVLLTPTYVWLGVLFIAVVVLTVTDVSQLIYRASAQWFLDDSAHDPARRTSLARLFGGFAALVIGGASLTALKVGLSKVRVREVRVPLRRLPRELDGTTIVQLTDMHIGPTIGREFVEDIVERVNALNPDLVAITGDLVDGTVENLRDAVAPLGKLKSRHGTFFVTGNHEYYSGSQAWCRELSRLGIRVLNNECVSIGDDACSFDLAGINDFTGAQLDGEQGPDLARALAGRDPNRELVLLAHQPKAIHEAEQHGVGLQLSGHTHGGQIWPWNWLVKLQQPVVAGLERIGQAFVYVSAGTGYWGPPMRLGTAAEVTHIVLETADESATA